MKLVFFILTLMLAGAGAYGLYYLSLNMPVFTHPYTQKNIHLGSNFITVDVADTDALRTQGLSGRATLAQGSGMLFVFEVDDLWGIWMKGMRFAIDIIWLDKNGAVVTIARDVSPASYPTAFYPERPARYVLEVPAGYVAAYNIAEGDVFVLQ